MKTEFEILCWRLWRHRNVDPVLRALAHLAWQQIRNLRTAPNANLVALQAQTRHDLLEAL